MGDFITIGIMGGQQLASVGKIINTDEDMIELQILDNITNELSDDVIFIDFAYKGIPKDLNIKEIILREKPNILETIDEKIEADDRGEQTILTQVLNDTIDIDTDNDWLKAEKCISI